MSEYNYTLGIACIIVGVIILAGSVLLSTQRPVDLLIVSLLVIGLAIAGIGIILTLGNLSAMKRELLKLRTQVK